MLVTGGAGFIWLEFYETFLNGEVVATSTVATEMTNLTENLYCDVNIAFVH